jgi:hypothetical protein
MKLSNNKDIGEGASLRCLHSDRQHAYWKDKDMNLSLGKTYQVEGVCNHDLQGRPFVMIRNDVGTLDWYETTKFEKVES